jgi:phytoene synthase
VEPGDALKDIEQRLALVYASAEARPGLTTLWQLDERLGGVVRRASEPMIAAIRLAWWRESLEKLDAGASASEPLLLSLARNVVPSGITGAGLAELEQGWASLLNVPPDDDALEGYARDRGGRLFRLSAQLLGQELPLHGEAAGEAWALSELASFARDPDLCARARAMAVTRVQPSRWPPRLRALGMLSILARRDLSRDQAEVRGAPARVARALWHRISGR